MDNLTNANLRFRWNSFLMLRYGFSESLTKQVKILSGCGCQILRFGFKVLKFFLNLCYDNTIRPMFAVFLN